MSLSDCIEELECLAEMRYGNRDDLSETLLTVASILMDDAFDETTDLHTFNRLVSGLECIGCQLSESQKEIMAICVARVLDTVDVEPKCYTNVVPTLADVLKWIPGDPQPPLLYTVLETPGLCPLTFLRRYGILDLDIHDDETFTVMLTFLYEIMNVNGIQVAIDEFSRHKKLVGSLKGDRFVQYMHAIRSSDDMYGELVVMCTLRCAISADLTHDEIGVLVSDFDNEAVYMLLSAYLTYCDLNSWVPDERVLRIKRGRASKYSVLFEYTRLLMAGEQARSTTTLMADLVGMHRFDLMLPCIHGFITNGLEVNGLYEKPVFYSIVSAITTGVVCDTALLETVIRHFCARNRAFGYIYRMTVASANVYRGMEKLVSDSFIQQTCCYTLLEKCEYTVTDQELRIVPIASVCERVRRDMMASIRNTIVQGINF